jgi:hypothetical protein
VSIYIRKKDKMGYMNQYIAAYLSRKFQLYRELALSYSHPDHVFKVNWIRHYHSMESRLNLKNIKDIKQRVF